MSLRSSRGGGVLSQGDGKAEAELKIAPASLPSARALALANHRTGRARRAAVRPFSCLWPVNNGKGSRLCAKAAQIHVLAEEIGKRNRERRSSFGEMREGKSTVIIFRKCVENTARGGSFTFTSGTNGSGRRGKQRSKRGDCMTGSSWWLKVARV